MFPLPLAAIITAGGQSRRYGSDKALAQLQGLSLLERVALSLEAASPKVLVAPSGRYTLSTWHAVPDTRPGQGPLAGLEAGLLALRQANWPGAWAALSAVDLPHLTPEFWAVLGAARQTHAGAVVGLSADGRPQPLAALYSLEALSTVSALLDAGERRMLTLLSHLEVAQVPWQSLQAAAPRAYQNVNAPSDLI